ncbi:S8 family peptidase [Tepidibacter mesophilus]|uniref:S8 family peptidase n=1 Tax=Tepidibacter mesophilus TaxID=655607 RepID=UPI000C07C59D|nr:S8 family peptidase [Tepidibacter mesophilus]
MYDVKLLSFRKHNNFNITKNIPGGVELIKAPTLWKQGFRGDGITIAVLDTGCDYNHPNLKNNIIGGYNFTGDYNKDVNNFYDENGHGTHVAGTIAASDNRLGIIGVAPNAKLLILKALSNSGRGNYKDIVEAIEYAINWTGPNKEKVRVISMSLGLNRDVKDFYQVIKKAVKNNILLICSSGNMGDGKGQTDELQYPAIYPEVLQIGAIDMNKKIAFFSNTNSELDIVAPGVNIISTFPKGNYMSLSGTSMAAPHVAGAAALLIEKYEKKCNKNLKHSEIFKLVCEHTKTIGSSKNEEGNGLIYLGS